MTSDQVCRRARVTFRQLDYWTRTGRIPGVDRLQSLGSGHPREWTATECAYVEVLARLVRAGVRVDIAAAALQQQIDVVGRVTDVHQVRLPEGVVLMLRPALVAAS